MIKSVLLLVFSLTILTACSSTDDDTTAAVEMYFPPITGNTWETTNPTSLEWDELRVTDLKNFLEQNETRAFIVLVDGKIVIEEYWNDDLAGQPFDMNSNWYWASAGKSLAATVIGIAQEDGFIDINSKTSDYLGNGWTNMPQDKEDLITIKNHLTQTTGIDYNVTNENCFSAECFNYLTDAGNQWYYHNGTYQILHSIIEISTGMDKNVYTDIAIENKIGMNGQWTDTALFDNLYISTARDAARFGLLTLNKGNWDGNAVLGNATYFNEMTTTSQNINESYGYLWWLNGKNSVVFPGFTSPVASSVTPSGPDDMISALGKNGQFIDVVPSLNMVVIRMGDTSAQEPVPVLFHDEMWNKITQLIEN
ncbi:MAG: serine hydrolase domain-containing protein [Nonlabens sp.]|uniref:serine hydrolase domain-containing protein n=1 Tax=Nonlabens sp. TaxID=1888209 RepID=UPI003EF63D2E